MTLYEDPAKATSAPARLANRSILIIDDYRDWAETIGDRLGRLGLDCFVVTKIADAEHMLKSNRIGLVILDGELEDGRTDPQGTSGSFIQSHLEGAVRYVRLAGDPFSIPLELQGDGCFSKNDFGEFEKWIEERLPVG